MEKCKGDLVIFHIELGQMATCSTKFELPCFVKTVNQNSKITGSISLRYMSFLQVFFFIFQSPLTCDVASDRGILYNEVFHDSVRELYLCQ